MNTDLTMVLCTLDRATTLARALSSMCRLALPCEFRWEILVINNGSTDNTSEVIRSFTERLPIREVVQPMKGLSRARNAGVREAQGELVAFVDDDVEVDSHWLTAYAEGLRAYPEAAFFGGPIVPRYSSVRPLWLTDELESGILSGVCVCRRMGDRVRPYAKADELPFGANCGVRRNHLVNRPFRADLGVRGGARLCQEETELLRSLMSRGLVGMYLPDALVWHHTDGARLRLPFIIEHAYGCGRSDVISGAEAQPNAKRWAHWLPNWYIRKLLVATLRLMFHRRGLSPTEIRRETYELVQKWGRVREWTERSTGTP